MEKSERNNFKITVQDTRKITNYNWIIDIDKNDKLHANNQS